MPRTLCGADAGFTYIELIIVCVVLGLLVALALPSYIGTRSRAATDEANHIAQEWKSFAWGCYIQTQDITQCASNTSIGFSEVAGRYWNWSSTTPTGATYAAISPDGIPELTVSWPSTNNGLEIGETYTITLFAGGPQAGQATATCIPAQC